MERGEERGDSGKNDNNYQTEHSTGVIGTLKSMFLAGKNKHLKKRRQNTYFNATRETE